VPPHGGNTEFADMRAAYDDLPAALKSKLETLRAEHSIWHSRALCGGTNFRPDEIATMPPVVQPMLRNHPRTDRRSMVLASHISHILDMSQDESSALLEELMIFSTQPKYYYSHEWRAGDLVIWDNRCTMHRGTPFNDQLYRRDMRRTTVQGPSRYSTKAP
jgi:alpha-ketoglutarate-dependent 2,4-dichlorophenoxyacetate dioxygenase